MDPSESQDKRAASRFTLEGRVASFGYAFRGLALVARSQHNAWIHAVATVAVVTLGLIFSVSRMEWCVLVLAIGAVWIAEALNTALELLADAVSLEAHPLVGQAKDAAAGGVLIAAIASALVGVLVLAPHCLRILGVG
ncbi:MAG: diacylglycerol kinase [Myxococcota bacterium]|jgi:diacylglycerol kinase